MTRGTTVRIWMLGLGWMLGRVELVLNVRNDGSQAIHVVIPIPGSAPIHVVAEAHNVQRIN